jgi:hypothetical protein
MNPLRFTRRNLLRGALATTALIPCLDARRIARAQAEPIRRLVVFTMPNGTRNDMFWPSGSGANYQLRPLTAPLEPFKSKLTFLKGIRLNDSLQDGALGGTLGSEHARGTGGMLTARPLNSGSEFVSFGNTTSGWGSGQSIDQYLVDRLAPPTTFSSLHLGVHVRDTEVRARISYRASNQPIPPREDPADVFSTLFGAATNTPGAPSPGLERLRAQRKSVFDLTNAETRRISQLVGAEDRAKLDAHLTAMREVEQRLIGATGTGTVTGTGTAGCAGPEMQSVDLGADDQYELTGRLQMDLAAAALACDLTRILTLQLSYSESEHLFRFLGISGSHHVISHDFSPSGTNFEAYNTIQVWYAEQLAYFLGKLASYQEGGATLLDNSLVLWATEIGEATSHDLRLMPYVLAGSAGGRIRAGRLVDYGNNPRDNNQMLVSIARAMGADDLTAFGDESGAAGPLPDLA